jgi:O-acetylserine/cysteine efflux transporter
MRPLHLAAAVLVAAIWGANFVAAKLGMQHLPPLLITGLRFSVVAILLTPFVPIPRDKLKAVFWVSTTLGTIHFGLLFIGLAQGLQASTASIIVQLGVPFACVLGTIFLGDRLGWYRSSAMMVCFLGAMLLAGSPNIIQHPLGFWLSIGGSFFWAVGNIQIKKLGEINSLSLVAWTAMFCAPQILLLSAIFETGQIEAIRTAPLWVWSTVAYSACVSSMVAYSLWYWLMARYPMSQIAPFNLLSPVFGVLAGVLMLGETLTWHMLVGGAITMAGVAVIVIRRPRTAEGSPT